MCAFFGSSTVVLVPACQMCCRPLDRRCALGVISQWGPTLQVPHYQGPGIQATVPATCPLLVVTRVAGYALIGPPWVMRICGAVLAKHLLSQAGWVCGDGYVPWVTV